MAIANYTGARKLYPGYRDVLQTNSGLLPVSWTVAILPYMEQRVVSDQWKQMLNTANQGLMPFPFLEPLVCPSDLTTQNVAAPISYVVNCGQPDLFPLASIGSQSFTVGGPTSPYSGSTSGALVQPDIPANGIFLSRWDANWAAQGKLTSLPRNTDDTVRDGKSNTLLLSENLEARNWYDELSLGDPNPADQGTGMLTASSGANTAFSTNNVTTSNNGYFGAPVGGVLITSATPSAPQKLSPEAYAGFIWWPYNVPPAIVANINGLPATEVGYATDMMYVRPSSNHPGIVVAGYADGRVNTLSENINYFVYCLLMTPDGTKCNPAGLPFIPSNDTTLPAAYTNSQSATGGFRNSTISGQDIQ